MAKELKDLILRGDEFQWNVVSCSAANRDAVGAAKLNQVQVSRLRECVRELARHDDPTHSDTLSIDAIEDYYELREWGGARHPKNVRVFFGVDKGARRIVLLGVHDKRNNGATPQAVKLRMAMRWKAYQRGELG